MSKEPLRAIVLRSGKDYGLYTRTIGDLIERGIADAILREIPLRNAADAHENRWLYDAGLFNKAGRLTKRGQQFLDACHVLNPYNLDDPQALADHIVAVARKAVPAPVSDEGTLRYITRALVDHHAESYQSNKDAGPFGPHVDKFIAWGLLDRRGRMTAHGAVLVAHVLGGVL